MSEWKKVRLGEVTSIKTGKLNSCAAVDDGCYPFFTCAENPLRINTAAYDSESVLVAGNCTPYVNYYKGKFNAYQRTYIITPTVEDLFGRWLFYWMRQKIKMMIHRQQGSVEKYFVLSDFTEEELTLPSLPTQRKIAAVLSSLDDKIENNRKICANLEAQAQAIFKSWFVDFEPFGGKMPQGWKMGKLGDVAIYRQGKIAANELTAETYYSTENMLPDKQGLMPATSLPQIGEVPVCEKGDVLISNIRPYFKKICFSWSHGGHSPDVLCLAAKNDNMRYWLYRQLWDDAFFAYVMSSAKGTKMPRGDKEQILAYGMAIPNENDVARFNAVIEPMCESIVSKGIESRALAATRDALLPKLMSGEIDVERVEVA